MLIKHGLYHHPLYKKYYAIKSRCENMRDKDYKDYGGRGIKVIWKSIESFVKDMEKNYFKLASLDRINVNGNYCKENCRWITMIEQQKNKRTTVFLTYNNETLHLAEWARKSGLKKSTFSERYRKGWTIQQIMETPTLAFNAKKIDNGKKVK